MFSGEELNRVIAERIVEGVEAVASEGRVFNMIVHFTIRENQLAAWGSARQPDSEVHTAV